MILILILLPDGCLVRLSATSTTPSMCMRQQWVFDYLSQFVFTICVTILFLTICVTICHNFYVSILLMCASTVNATMQCQQFSYNIMSMSVLPTTNTMLPQISNCLKLHQPIHWKLIIIKYRHFWADHYEQFWFQKWSFK